MKVIFTILFAMACSAFVASAVDPEPENPIRQMGMIHGVLPVTLRGITARFWWSPFRALPVTPGFRTSMPPFNMQSGLLDVATGGSGDFYTREFDTPPDLVRTAQVFLFLCLQGLAFPIYACLSRDGRVIGFVDSPLNYGPAGSRVVVGNAGIEIYSPLAAVVFEAPRFVVAKSVLMTRRIMTLLAFVGNHALFKRENAFYQVDESDNSFTSVADLKRGDIPEMQFRFQLVVFIHKLADSAFETGFLVRLRTLWNGRFTNFLDNDLRFAAALSRIAPLLTGVLFQGEIGIDNLA